MCANLNIVIFRHPDEVNDNITPEGGMKCIKLAHWLKHQNLIAEIILHSDTNCAQQAAWIMTVATDLYGLHPEKESAFNRMGVIREYFGGNVEAIEENGEAIKKEGGSIREALRMNTYVRRARDLLRLALAELGGRMLEAGQHTCWIVSHGRFAELAVTETVKGNIPFGIDYCDTMLYQLDYKDLEIIYSKYIPFATVIDT